MEAIVRKIDFALAKCKHLEWKGRLVAALDGRDDLTEAEVSSPRNCELGRWLYSYALEQYPNVPSIHELERVHEQLHSVAVQVLQTKNAGDLRAAHIKFCKLEQMSDRILALLNEVERQL